MLTIVGELINTSRPAVKEAALNRDKDLILDLAIRQAKAGATFIDVNCGNLINNEEETMEWLVNTIQSEVEVPLCIDSPSASALDIGLSLCKFGRPMINSISDEDERYDAVLPLIKKYDAKIVVLCMDSSGMPVTADDRMKVVHKLRDKLADAGVKDDDMYFDPLVKPVSSVSTAGIEVLETIKKIRTDYPDVHFMCGLSNISYGLPNRAILNRLFVVETMTLGMDGYVLDPTNNKTMADIATSKALLGMDNYCGGYIKAHRSGLLG